MSSPDSTSVPDDLREYSTFTSDIDLTDTTAGSSQGRPARYIKVCDVTAGTTLAVVLTGSNGTTRTMTVAYGEEILGKFTTIKSTTDVTRVRVGW